MSDEKIYSEHDMETRERIVTIEKKLDNLTDNTNLRFSNMEGLLKSIHHNQTKEVTLKDSWRFAKKNYKILLLVLVVLVGGDSLRENIVKNIFSIVSAQSDSDK
jgi:hypothetical protein